MHRRLRAVFWACWFAVFAISCAKHDVVDPAAETAPAAARRVLILHTSDEHSHLLGVGPEVDDYPTPRAGTGLLKGGVTRRATVLRREREWAESRGIPSLTVSSGDNMMGTLFQASLAKVSADYRAMQMLGYDVATFGNHDVELGPQFLAATLKVAFDHGVKFPFVASNIHFTGRAPAPDSAAAAMLCESGTDRSKPMQRLFIKELPNGLRVGFLGAMGANAAVDAPGKAPVHFSLPPSGDENDVNGVLAALYAELTPLAARLRTVERADLVVLLGHTGVNLTAPEKGESWRIAANVPGIDVVLSGHTHFQQAPFVVRNKKTGRKVFVAEPGCYGKAVGRYVFAVGPGGVTLDPARDEHGYFAPVDDTSPPTDAAAFGSLFDESIRSLETDEEWPGAGRSMLERTVIDIEGRLIVNHTPPTGYLFFRPLGATRFNVTLNPQPAHESGMLRLAADAVLDGAERAAGPTTAAVTAAGVVRDGIWEGYTGRVSLADVFRVFALGQSPERQGPDYATPGYPLTRFAVSGFELLLLLEGGLYYSQTIDSDRFLLPAGVSFEYSPKLLGVPVITRLAINGDRDEPDRATTVIFDLKRSPWTLGWKINPFKTYYTVAMDSYLASFVAASGLIKMRDPSNLRRLFKTPTEAIVRRADRSEVKAFEALAVFIAELCAKNRGFIPERYAEPDPARAVARRAVPSR
jgi:2',3'-cyclic-nucleotide 2'-phosphodiesterase (5'-nucleotidase family)